MSRYIDADIVLDKMRSTFDMQDLYLPIHFKELIIDEMPTADVKEVVHGEWRYGENDIGLDGYWCTACGRFVLWDYKESIDFIHRYNYCPNCGADMRGES